VTDLTCPKCHGAMRTYERSNVTVDQCMECRGIFLDRGELERLIDAETAWAARQPETRPQGQPTPPPAQPPYQEHDYDQRRKDPHKKRRSFLEDLFD